MVQAKTTKMVHMDNYNDAHAAQLQLCCVHVKTLLQRTKIIFNDCLLHALIMTEYYMVMCVLVGRTCTVGRLFSVEYNFRKFEIELKITKLWADIYKGVGQERRQCCALACTYALAKIVLHRK